MIKNTLAIVAATALVVGCMMLPAREKPLDDQAWELTCSYIECGDLVKPYVVVDDDVFDLNFALMWALGFYLGGDEIYVREPSESYDMDKWMQTLIHEMVHYVTVMRDEYPDICDNEANAFAVADRYARDIDREDLVRGSTWWEPYERCQNYGVEE